MKIAVLDIESKTLVEDWSRPWEAGLSVACVWASWLGGPWGSTHFFGDKRLSALSDMLATADVVVSWNGIRYDLAAINGIIGESVPIKHHCDLMARLQKSCGRRWSLEPTAMATLGRGKAGKGAMAPKMYQDGHYDQLYTYNSDDVALTRDLYLFARDHGFLWVPDGQSRRPVAVDVN